MPFYFFFLLTIVLELPLVLLFFKKQWKFALLIGLLLNLFTWPLLHLLLYHTNININILEVGVALAEGLGFFLFLDAGWKKAFGVAFLVNGFSYGAGLLINNWL